MDIWKYLTKFNMIGCLTFVIIFGEVMGVRIIWISWDRYIVT